MSAPAASTKGRTTVVKAAAGARGGMVKMDSETRGKDSYWQEGL